MKKFYYVRHGETKWNLESLCQGHQDIKLSAKGEQDAHKLKDFFQNKKIKRIFTSPLQRAKQTATIISNTLANVRILHGLRERGFGLFEGVPNNLMYAIEDMELSRSFDKEQFYKNFKVEPINTIVDRVDNALQEITQCPEDEILVVSHGRTFNFICYCLGVEGIKQLKHNQIIYFYQEEKCWSYEIHEI